MKIFTSVLAGFVFFALSLAEAATFSAPKNYSIVIVDGSKSGNAIVNSKEVNLEPGQHQIVVFFKGLFKHRSDQIIVSATDPIVINIPNVEKDDNYTFTYPRIRSYDDAQDFADHQTITLTNNGESVSKDKASFFILQSDKGFQLDRDFLEELNSLGLLYVSQENNIKQEKKDDSIANCRDSSFVNCPKTIKASGITAKPSVENPVKKAAPVSTKATTTVANTVAETTANTQMLDGLKSIYNGADPATKKAFKKWLEQQK